MIIPMMINKAKIIQIHVLYLELIQKLTEKLEFS